MKNLIILLSLFFLGGNCNGSLYGSVWDNPINYRITSFSDQEITGTLLTTTEESHLLKIRFLCEPDDKSDHSIRVWIKNGNNFSLTYGPYLWSIKSGTSGWMDFEFPDPLLVHPNITYFISVGYVPYLTSSSGNPASELNVSDRISNSGTTAQNGGATIPTSWFINNYERIVVVLSTKFRASVIGPSQEICFNTRALPLVQITEPAGGAGVYTYKWQSSSDSLNWLDIPGAKYDSYTPPVLTESTWYRCVVTSGASGSLNSNSVHITVLNPLLPGSIGISQTICYNTSPSLISAKIDPSGGQGTYSYRWQASIDGITWANIESAGNKYYQPGNLRVTTWFRRLVSSGACDEKSSNEVKIAVNPDLDPGTIGSAQTICNNSTPEPLTNITYPSGGTGVYAFQWQSSTDNSHWAAVPGATLSTFAPPALKSNTWYRRQVVNDTCNVKSSNSVLMTVNPALIACTIGNAQEICYNTAPSELKQITAPSGGSGSYNFQWQTSLDNNNWVNIQNATNAAYTSPALTSTAWYRCNVSSGSCGSVASNPLQITVYTALSAGTIGPSQIICNNETPAVLNQVTAPSGADGIFTYQWQRSGDKNSWTDISGAISISYSPPALTSNTWFRCKVSNIKCGSTSTNSVSITVNPSLTGGTIGSDQTICYNATPAALTQISVPTGGTGSYTYQWQSSNDNSNWTNITGALLSTYSPPALSTTTWYRRYTGSGDCKLVTGNSVRIDVYPEINPGAAGTSQSICYGTTPEALTQTAPPSGGTGTYAFQWQSSPDYSSWTNISGATSSSFAPPSLTSTTWYRRNITSGSCETVSGSSVRITVNTQLTAGTIGSDQSLCYNNIPSPLVQITPASGGTGTYTYQWQSSSDNSIWSNIPGATSSGYAPPSLTSSTWYRRVVTSGSCGSTNSNAVHITIYPVLSPGTIGSDQSICYNTVPLALTQLSAPSGGTGSYTYQWQRSADNSSWTNISGATSSSLIPPNLTSGTWFRRSVSCAGCSASSNTVHITVFSAITVAQLHDSKTITPGTSTSISVSISGGTAPYSVSYTRNGIAQEQIVNYSSGTNISTGILDEGTYTYMLTSVTDSHECNAQNLGSSITIRATSNLTSTSNIALVLVNSGSSYYSHYTNYIQPYLDNFGIPYEVCNVSTTALPDLTDYAVIIFGHRNVYSSGYPISELETAVNGGTGLYSFDPHLFDYASGFNALTSPQSVSSNQITVSNTSHYITQKHVPDTFNPTSDIIQLFSNWSITRTSNLVNGNDLALLGSCSLLQTADYGNGRVVKWSGYDWMFESLLGPLHGMDDLIWRGIVWCARKPFIMQGLPPMLTMRVDDVEGIKGGVTDNFLWVQICNEFGIIPWVGTFNNNIRLSNIPTLKSLIDNNLVTASPHAFGSNFIYFNHNGLTTFDAAANVRAARDFYIQNGLKMSKYVVPHFYEVSSEALSEIRNMGVEFLGIHMLPDNFYSSTVPWINCKPYRINRNGYAHDNDRPVYYGGYINLSGIQFFICVTEIRDDGGYEWFPDTNITATVARGIRHLKRSFDSMVLASLFTHEYYFEELNSDQWRDILGQITSNLTGYNPEFRSTDYAVQYIRAKSNIRITDVIDSDSETKVSYSGSNDMDTKCYMFNESGGQITYRFVTLPRIDGSNSITVTK